MADPKKSSSSKSRSTKLGNAGAAAQSQSDRDTASEVLPCQKEEDENHWIEILLVGGDGEGIGNNRCIVTAPDGKEHRVKTDVNGVIRLEGIPAGKCQVSFVDLDKNAWEASA